MCGNPTCAVDYPATVKYLASVHSANLCTIAVKSQKANWKAHKDGDPVQPINTCFIHLVSSTCFFYLESLSIACTNLARE